jgi:hypothetical protein
VLITTFVVIVIGGVGLGARRLGGALLVGHDRQRWGAPTCRIWMSTAVLAGLLGPGRPFGGLASASIYVADGRDRAAPPSRAGCSRATRAPQDGLLHT